MPDQSTAPEKGYQSTLVPAIGSFLDDGRYRVDDWDETLELRFPMSVAVYDRMRKTDGQIGAIMRAVKQPILSAQWRLNTDGVNPAVAQFVETSLGLNVSPKARRRRQGIVWSEHLRQCLLFLDYGFMPFETVYEAAPPPPDMDTRGLPAVMHHLRKLGPRMPRTIREVVVDRDGGLLSIIQNPLWGLNPTQRDWFGVEIPVDRLVMYVNDKEGADWTGTSLLRSAYKHWLVKDQMIRTGAMSVERNNMGVPVVTYQNADQRADALAFARDFRSGAVAGGALEQGMSLALVGVSGSLVDELPRIQYHDQAISKSALAMFLDLGHDAGARSLGDTFVQQFLASVTAVIQNVAWTTTEHVIRDLVERNFGPDEPYPLLETDDITDESVTTIEGLVALATAGLLGDFGQDRDLLRDVRRRAKLPEIPDSVPGAPEPAAPAAPVDEGALVDDTTPDDSTVPGEVMATLSAADWYEPAMSYFERRLLLEQPVALLADPNPASNGGALKRYWVAGKGREKWIHDPHPWTRLYHFLRKYIKDDRVAKATAAKWFKEATGRWPNQQG